MDGWVDPEESLDEAQDRIVDERVRKKFANFLEWFEQIVQYIGLALAEYEANQESDGTYHDSMGDSDNGHN